MPPLRDLGTPRPRRARGRVGFAPRGAHLVGLAHLAYRSEAAHEPTHRDPLCWRHLAAAAALRTLGRARAAYARARRRRRGAGGRGRDLRRGSEPSGRRSAALPRVATAEVARLVGATRGDVTRHADALIWRRVRRRGRACELTRSRGSGHAHRSPEAAEPAWARRRAVVGLLSAADQRRETPLLLLRLARHVLGAKLRGAPGVTVLRFEKRREILRDAREIE